jgi:hypothetical protein
MYMLPFNSPPYRIVLLGECASLDRRNYRLGDPSHRIVSQVVRTNNLPHLDQDVALAICHAYRLGKKIRIKYSIAI